MATLGQALTRQARRVPRRVALVSDRRRLTYAELDAEVNRAAHALARAGLAKGDRLALMSPNTEGFVIVFYAAMRLGGVVVPINPRSAAPEVTYLLDDSGAQMFLFDPALAEVAVPAQANATSPPATLLTTAPAEGHDDLPARAAGEPSGEPDVAVDEADDAEILYTSGTTGRPKGVLLDQHRVVWDGVNINLTVGLGDGERMLHVAPLYHSAELNLFLNGGMLIGATHVLLPAFEPGTVIDAMERERITAFFGVPTMYQFMLARPEFTDRDLSAWRIGMFGAAPMPPATIHELSKAAPQVRLFNLCGPTEAGPSGIFLGPEDIARKPSANGRAITGMEARVVDENDVDVEPGGTGELILRGETLMKGYWNMPEATAETLRGGWLRTGDLARVDDEYDFTLVDRTKDMIITGGMNVYSVEVENALAAHPDISDCAVVGTPHPQYGESIVAVVTPREGAELTLEGIKTHLRELIADYKAPHRLVMGDVPRNPSGKIVKNELREGLAEH